MEKFRLRDWRTEALLIQDVTELPDWRNTQRLFFDVETTSREDKIASVNPWHNCALLGLAVLRDDDPKPLYIPLRHRGPNSLGNVPINAALAWLQRTLDGTENWINHNINYDRHVCANEGVHFNGTCVDTLTLCKLSPNEERFAYDLDKIMQDWFYHDISTYEEDMKLHLGKGIKDYGLIPIDKMTQYAAVDVLSVRKIYNGITKTMPAECARVVSLEQEVTPILFDIEREGMTLDSSLLDKHYRAYPVYLAAIQRECEKLTGFVDFRPHTNADCKSLLCEEWGLPVLEFTDKGRPSFGSDTILAYKAMDPGRTDVYDWIIKYKELHKLYTSFTVSYQEKKVGNRIHCSYNQAVRTGRLSCRQPNMQQLSPAAKAYIVPSSSDRCIVDIDFSQIEFRLIAHYIKASKIIEEYNKNTDADYHDIVAEMCSIERYPAKRINFMLGYGGGRGKCIEILASIPSIIGELKNKEAIEARANDVYKRYHKMVPTLKPTTYNASAVMRQRGYVRTLLGRRRYLPKRAHFKAFNTIIQGSAADLFKAALVRVAQYCSVRTEVKLIGCVHDSFVFDMPKDSAQEHTHQLINLIAELPKDVTLRVPLRADAKASDKNWKECG